MKSNDTMERSRILFCDVQRENKETAATMKYKMEKYREIDETFTDLAW